MAVHIINHLLGMVKLTKVDTEYFKNSMLQLKIIKLKTRCRRVEL